MPNSNLNILHKTFDPIQMEQQARYRTLGLTYISNNDSIIPRDAAGNIVMQEGSTKNPLLIIDPVAEQITTKSALRVLDTAFQYYKFPVSIAVTSSATNFDLTYESIDMVYARYKPLANQQIQTGNTVDPYSQRASGIEISVTVDGVSQTSPNKYYITKDIKSAGIDLRFRIKINHRFDSPNNRGAAFFYVSKEGPNTPLQRTYLGPYAATSPTFPTIVGAIGRYEVQDTFIDVVIPNSEFAVGDIFGITAFCDKQTATEYHTINAEQTYWVITDASKNVDEWNQVIS